jgi:hypothetical protein
MRTCLQTILHHVLYCTTKIKATVGLVAPDWQKIQSILSRAEVKTGELNIGLSFINQYIACIQLYVHLYFKFNPHIRRFNV